MKEELYAVLTELNDIKSKLESIICVMGSLEHLYENQNQLELFSTVQVIREYLKALDTDVAIVTNRVDKLELRCGRTDKV